MFTHSEALNYTNRTPITSIDDFSSNGVLSVGASLSSRRTDPFVAPLSTGTSILRRWMARSPLRTSIIRVRGKSDAVNLTVLGVLVAALCLVMIAVGIMHGWKWRKSMLRILDFQQGKFDILTSELPAPEPIHEKDSRGIGDAEIGQRYELDAQSDRSFRTRLSRAFSLRRKPIVDGSTVESGTLASNRLSTFNSLPVGEEVPPVPRAALVLEAIILPELPAQSVRVRKASSIVIPKRDDGRKRAEAEKLRVERLRWLKAQEEEEEEIQKMFAEVDLEKGLKEGGVKSVERVPES
jgi:hypothetical protein